MRRFQTRTVRHGAVKLGGRMFRPQNNHLAYDGRLEGQRLRFSLYPSPWLPDGFEPYVYLVDSPDIDGGLPWMFWESTSPASVH